MKPTLVAAVLVLSLGSSSSFAGGWQTLDTFDADGSEPFRHSGMTADGVTISFALAADCVPCGTSRVCFDGTSVPVEYLDADLPLAARLTRRESLPAKGRN